MTNIFISVVYQPNNESLQYILKTRKIIYILMWKRPYW